MRQPQARRNGRRNSSGGSLLFPLKKDTWITLIVWFVSIVFFGGVAWGSFVTKDELQLKIDRIQEQRENDMKEIRQMFYTLLQDGRGRK